MEVLDLERWNTCQMIHTLEKQLNVLLIEEEKDAGCSIENAIRENGKIALALTRVHRLTQGLESLKQKNFDIILLDSRLPERERLETFTLVKQQASMIPIIVLSCAGEFDLEAIRLGAQDCLPKNQVYGDRLLRSIVYSIERQREKERLQQQIARERQMGRIIERIRGSLDPRQILNTTVFEVRQLLNADRVFIYRANGGESARIVARAEKNSPDSADLPTPTQTLQQIQPFLSSSDCHLPPGCSWPRDLASRQCLNSIVNVPIWQTRSDHSTSLWGQLIAQDASGDRSWQEWEIGFLSQLAQQVAIAILQSELYQTVERQASADGLTGIANRRQFDRQLAEEWQKHARYRLPLSLILCDVDFFKRYNDFYGHLAGDDCLKKVAAAIARSCRRMTDIPCRYGGEEFAVILPKTDYSGAFQVGRSIKQTLAKMLIAHEGSLVSDRVTLSIGIATHIPDRSLLAETLIESADHALRSAKTNGRNQIISR
jgi:two-component system, cell cycle response regulator